MTREIQELLAQAKAAYDAGGAIKAAAEKAERDLTAEELGQIEKHFADAIELKGKADKLASVEERGEELKQSLNAPRYKFAFGGDDAVKAGVEVSEKQAFERWLQVKGNRWELNPAELKTLSRLTATDGGFWVPEGYASEIKTKLDALLHFRRICTVMTVGTDVFNMPTGSLAVTVARLSDNAAITAQSGTSPAGNVAFSVQDYKAVVQVPNGLLRSASFNLQAYITDRISRGVAQAEEVLFMTGSGANAPLGLLNAGLNATDIGTATSDTIVPDDIQGLPFRLEAQYRGNASWLMPRYVARKVALLRTNDGGANTGRYLWEPDFTAPGAPARLVGYPVYETEYGFTAEGSTADGDALAIFGDFRQGYTIADRVSMMIDISEHIYFANDQTAFRVMFGLDAKVTDINAFRRLDRT